MADWSPFDGHMPPSALSMLSHFGANLASHVA
jgi:hypothetical protein